MSQTTKIQRDLTTVIANEYRALADLLENSPASVWDAPSLCEGWRTREVVAHVTMPARYTGPMFMAELEAVGGDFTRFSNTVAERDGALPSASLLTDLRSVALHEWTPPGGGQEGALTHCVIHELDITEALGVERGVSDDVILGVLGALAGPDRPNLFGVDLTGVELRANDLDWSFGAGDVVTGPAQVLTLVLSGRKVRDGRLAGRTSEQFTRRSFP